MKSNFEGKRYSSKRRKIHKLKRENVVLGQQRKQLLNYMIFKKETSWLGGNRLYKTTLNIMEISENIGKNSAKIQRLRTLIQQEKKANEHSNCT